MMLVCVLLIYKKKIDNCAVAAVLKGKIGGKTRIGRRVVPKVGDIHKNYRKNSLFRTICTTFVLRCLA